MFQVPAFVANCHCIVDTLFFVCFQVARLRGWHTGNIIGTTVMGQHTWMPKCLLRARMPCRIALGHHEAGGTFLVDCKHILGATERRAAAAQREVERKRQAEEAEAERLRAEEAEAQKWRDCEARGGVFPFTAESLPPTSSRPEDQEQSLKTKYLRLKNKETSTQTKDEQWTTNNGSFTMNSELSPKSTDL